MVKKTKTNKKNKSIIILIVSKTMFLVWYSNLSGDHFVAHYVADFWKGTWPKGCFPAD